MEVTDPYAPLVGFDSRKAAQIAAYFAQRDNCRIEKLKLIKLMYLAERESMSRHAHPMFYDEYYSMKHGPVCSSSLNGIDGNLDHATWGTYVVNTDNVVTPTGRFSRDDLDEVSDAEVAIIEHLWRRFGHMNASAIRNYTHDHCPEYVEVSRGRLPISPGDVYTALGKDSPAALADEIRSFRRLESLFAA